MGLRFRTAPPPPSADPDLARRDRIYADLVRPRNTLERFAEGFLAPDAPARRRQLRASMDNLRNAERYGAGAFDDDATKRRSQEVLSALHEDDSAPAPDTRSAYRKYGPLAMRAAGGVLPGIIGLASKIPVVGRVVGRVGIPAMLASGAIGESAATLSELATGDRKAAEETPRKTLARIGVAAGMNTITGGLFSKAMLPARLAGHAVSGAAQSAGSVAAEDILGEGRLPDAGELGEAARGGAIFGGVLGAGGELAVGAGRLAQRVRERARARDLRGGRPAPVERAPWEKGGTDDVEFEPYNPDDLAEPPPLPEPPTTSRRGRAFDPRYELEDARQPSMAFDEPVRPGEFGAPTPDFESRASLTALRRRLSMLESDRRVEASLAGADEPTSQRRGRPFDARFEDPQPGQLPILEDPNTIEAPGAEPPVQTAISRATSPLMQRILDLEASRRTAAAVEAGREPTAQRGGAPFDPRYELEGAKPAELPLGEGRPVEEITTPGAEPLPSDVRREAAEQTSALRSMMERLMRRPPDAAAGTPPPNEARQAPLPGLLDQGTRRLRVKDPELLTPPPTDTAAAPAPKAEPAAPARPFIDVGDDVLVGKERGKVIANSGRKGEPMVVEFTGEDGTVYQRQVKPERAALVKPTTPAVDNPEALVTQQEQADAAARGATLAQEMTAHAEASRQGQAPPKRPASVITPGGGDQVVAATERDARNITKGDLARRLRMTKLEAVKDPVTGGLNRQGFEQARERRAIGPAQSRVVMRADLDNFKAINDELGHEAGDKALKVVHDAIKARLRQGDLVSRVGGDEFAMDLHLGDPAKAPQIAAELEEAVNQALEQAGFGTAKGRQVGISIGHGADDAAADAAAMVRKAERGVSKPREDAPDVSTRQAVDFELGSVKLTEERGPGYRDQVLGEAGAGQPGLSVEMRPRTGGGAPRQHVVYRGPDGAPVATAILERLDDGRLAVGNLAAAEGKGLLGGRAMSAIAKKLQELDAARPFSGVSPDASRWISRLTGQKGAKKAVDQGGTEYRPPAAEPPAGAKVDTGDTPDTGPAALPAAIVDAPPKTLKELSDADFEALERQFEEIDDWMLHRGMSDEWKAQHAEAKEVLNGEARARRFEQEAKRDAEGLAAGTRMEIPASLRKKNGGYGLEAGDLGFEPNKKTGLRGARNTIKLPGVEGEFVYSGGMSHGPYQEHQTNRVVPEAEWTGPKRTHAEQRAAWDANEGGDFWSRRGSRRKTHTKPDPTQPARGDDTGEVVTINGKRYVITGEGPTLFSGKRPGPAEWWDLEDMAEFEPRRSGPVPTIPTKPEGRYGAGDDEMWKGRPYEPALEHARMMRGKDEERLAELLQRQAKPKKADQRPEQQEFIREQIEDLRQDMEADVTSFRAAFGDDGAEALLAPRAAAEPEPTTVLGKKLKVKAKSGAAKLMSQKGGPPTPEEVEALDAQRAVTSKQLKEGKVPVDEAGKTPARKGSRYEGDTLEDMLPQLSKEQRNRLSLVKQLEKELENPKLSAKKRKLAEADLAGIREEIEGTKSEMRDGWGDEGVQALEDAVVDHEPSKATTLPQRDPKVALRERAQQVVGDYFSGRNKDLSTWNEAEVRAAVEHVKASPSPQPEFMAAAAKRLGLVDKEYGPGTPAPVDASIEAVFNGKDADAEVPVETLAAAGDKAVKLTDRKMRQAKAAAPEIDVDETKLPVNEDPERVEGEPLKTFQFTLRGTGRVRTYQAKSLAAAKAKFDKKFKRSDIEEVKEIPGAERAAVTAQARMFRTKTKTTTTTRTVNTTPETPSESAPTGEVSKPSTSAVARFKALMKGGVKRILAEEGGEGWFSDENVKQFHELREELKADIEREVHNANRYMDQGDFTTAQRIMASAYERRMRYFLEDESGAIDPRTAWLMGRVAAGALYGSAKEPEDQIVGAVKYGALAGLLGSKGVMGKVGQVAKGGRATFREALSDLASPSQRTLKVREPRSTKEDLTPFSHGQTPEEAVPDWFDKIVPAMEKFDDALRAKGKNALPAERRAIRQKFLGRHAAELKAAAVAARQAGQPNKATYLRMLSKQLLDEPTVLERFLSGATGHTMSGQRIAAEVTQHIYRLGTGANWAAGFINRVAQPYLGLVAMPLRYLRKGKAYVRTPQGRALVEHLKLERPSDAPEGTYTRSLEKLDDFLQWPLRYGDIRNREDVFAGAYLFAKDNGRTHQASLRYAAETMRATQSMPGELGNPPMLRELGPLRPFMKYPIVWAELVSNVLKKPWNDEGKRRFLGAMLGAYIVGEYAGLDMRSILIPRFNISAQAAKAIEDIAGHLSRTSDHPFTEDLESALVPVQLRNTKETLQEFANSKDGLLTKSDQRGVVRKRTYTEGLLNTVLGIRTSRQRREQEKRTAFFEQATSDSRVASFESRRKRQAAAAAYDRGDMTAVREALRGLPPQSVSNFYRTRNRDAVERRRLQLSPRLRRRLEDLAAEARAEAAQP